MCTGALGAWPRVARQRKSAGEHELGNAVQVILFHRAVNQRVRLLADWAIGQQVVRLTGVVEGSSSSALMKPLTEMARSLWVRSLSSSSGSITTYLLPTL